MRATMMRRPAVSAINQADTDFGRTPAAFMAECACRMRGSLAGTFCSEAHSLQIPFVLRQVEHAG